jgi:hypothetical protein
VTRLENRNVTDSENLILKTVELSDKTNQRMFYVIIALCIVVIVNGFIMVNGYFDAEYEYGDITNTNTNQIGVEE